MSKFIDTTFSAEARSYSGYSYRGSRLSSATHMLDIPAELAVLVRAIHHNDFAITEITAVTEGVEASPLVLKILADHTARTGVPIRYTLQNTTGLVLFETEDARKTVPFYESPGTPLTELAARPLSNAKVSADAYDATSFKQKLRECAILGVTRNFPTRDGASGYGAAVRVTNGDIYFGGQYSAFDERLSVHAEMGVLLNALMDNAHAITHIGIASSKFVDTPCSPCGCCRQFIAEISRAYDFSPTIYLFASGNEKNESYTIDELLPVQWTNKK